jgi:hypothetical protein
MDAAVNDPLVALVGNVIDQIPYSMRNIFQNLKRQL